ncbi:hypothetical protein TWF281_006875 [Arthrobotrys megalospora]
MNILSLPLEIQTDILEKLPWHDHFAAAAVCTLWASVLQTRTFHRRRYYHKFPENWYTARRYPVFDTKTARAPQDEDEKTDFSLHVLLRPGLIVVEIRPSGKTTLFMMVPPRVCRSTGGRGWSDRDGAGILDPCDKFRRHMWTPIWCMVLEVGWSPLLSSDKLALTIQDNSFNNDDTLDMTIEEPLTGRRATNISFNIFPYNEKCHFIDSEKFDKVSRLMECIRPLGTFRDLVTGLQEIVKYHILCNPEALGCWCLIRDCKKFLGSWLQFEITIYLLVKDDGVEDGA